MILSAVKSTINRYKLVNKNDKILVGVSGGPDSVALLYILNSLSKELKISLHVAHLDHMLRKDSCKDKQFVESLSRKLKLPVTCARVDVLALAEKGSLEEAARVARLDFLFNLAGVVKADKIALGHNLDDQAETVLMRILRGAGLYGLAGILPKRDIDGFIVIRPLIEVKRKEIEAFLKRKKIRPCRDASNSEDIYFRNKIRNKLLPLLEKGYNQNIKEVLANMADSVGSDYDYLLEVAGRSMKNIKTSFNLDKLLKLHPALRRLIFRQAIARLKGDTRRITFQHVKEIEDLVLNRPRNSIVDLPKGVSVIKKKHLSFYRR